MATATTPQPDSEIVETENSLSLVNLEPLALQTIPDNPTYLRVAQIAKDAAANIKLIEEHFNDLRERRYAAWKRVCAVVAGKVKPLEDTKDRCRSLLGKYEYDQEQERRRIEDEERRKAEAKAQEDNEALATKLADEDRVEEGVAVLEQTPMTPPVMAPVTTPRVQGIGRAKVTYTAEVISKRQVVEAALNDGTLFKILTIDQKALDKYAAMMEESFNVPGCRLQKGVKSGSIRA